MNRIYDLQSIIKFFNAQKKENFEGIEALLCLNDDEISHQSKMIMLISRLRDMGLYDVGYTHRRRVQYRRKKRNDTSSERPLSEVHFPKEYMEVRQLNCVIGFSVALN